MLPTGIIKEIWSQNFGLCFVKNRFTLTKMEPGHVPWILQLEKTGLLN